MLKCLRCDVAWLATTLECWRCGGKDTKYVGSLPSGNASGYEVVKWGEQ